MQILVDMAADRGAFIDQSQSFNVHMSDVNFGKLTSLHFYAWKVCTASCCREACRLTALRHYVLCLKHPPLLVQGFLWGIAVAPIVLLGQAAHSNPARFSIERSRLLYPAERTENRHVLPADACSG